MLRGALAIAVLAALSSAHDLHAQRSCDDWSADVTAVEGDVQVLRGSRRGWTTVVAGVRLCSGDALRSASSSRATIRLPDGTALRLDENTTMAMPEPVSGQGSLIELLRGVIHVISRDPRQLLFSTPYANAGLEGTEFDIRVDDMARSTEVVVLEGAVNMTTPAGALSVPSHHIAVARDGGAPTATPYAEPIELMRWASYFPPVLAGPLPRAEDQPNGAERSQAHFYARRAAANLTTARIAAAEADLATALQIAPRDANALSLRALLALARGDRDTARRLVADALAAEPASVTARIVASHVEQSAAELDTAERVLREAASLEPDNAVVLTRLAEVALARGDVRTAIASATRARGLAPADGLPLVVLGFAHLRAFDTEAAAAAFDEAIELQPGLPLARLGAAQAAIRNGDLTEGRRHLELAVAQEPADRLIRSYMAKVYEAEQRGGLTATQLELAQELDSADPTSWLYSSLYKLRTNRPVDALRDLHEAARKNGDRPVFRSWLAIDEDIATRSASIGRVHNELGFGRLAQSDAWQALADDPANFAAHRLLADGYSTEPRHEIARVSELLASQLLQPANVAPIKPQLAQQNLFIAQRAGPSHTSFDELSAPVVANGLKLRASAVTGGNGIAGDDVSVAGLNDRLSYSVGHYRFETDGFRDNNDLDQTAANAFVQYRASQDTNLQFELRSTRFEHGDLTTYFNRDLYSTDLRFEENADTARVGAKHELTPRHTLLGSVIFQDVDSDAFSQGVFGLSTTQRGYSVDVQEIFRGSGLTLQSGLTAAQDDETTQVTLFGPPGADALVGNTTDTNRHVGLYSYVTLTPAPTLTLTAGASFDSIEIGPTEEDAVNPKVGIAWRPTARTTVRAAAFESLYNGGTTSSQNTQPRLEPTQVAGFTQILLGGRGDRTTLRGVGVDHELSPNAFVGWQVDLRRTERIATAGLDAQNTLQFTLRERVQQAYVYWMPHEQLSFAARYERGRYSSDPMQFLGYTHLKTARLPLEVRYFARGGLTAGLRASHVDQQGYFQVPALLPFDPPSLAAGEDRFWVVDAFVGYRLPNRRGLLSLNADNLLDESFQFQDIDPANPSLFPERLISLRFTLAFD